MEHFDKQLGVWVSTNSHFPDSPMYKSGSENKMGLDLWLCCSGQYFCCCAKCRPLTKDYK